MCELCVYVYERERKRKGGLVTYLMHHRVPVHAFADAAVAVVSPRPAHCGLMTCVLVGRGALAHFAIATAAPPPPPTGGVFEGKIGIRSNARGEKRKRRDETRQQAAVVFELHILFIFFFGPWAPLFSTLVSYSLSFVLASIQNGPALVLAPATGRGGGYKTSPLLLHRDPPPTNERHYATTLLPFLNPQKRRAVHNIHNNHSLRGAPVPPSSPHPPHQKGGRKRENKRKKKKGEKAASLLSSSPPPPCPRFCWAIHGPADEKGVT